MNDVTLRNVRIIFRNFAGAPTRFNAAGGKRTFSILLNEGSTSRLSSSGIRTTTRHSISPSRSHIV